MHSTIWWIVTGILFLGVYSILEFIYRYRVTFRGKKKIPTQLPLPLIGNALHFLKDRSTSGMLKAFNSYLPSCPISAAWLGPKLILMVGEPKLAHDLMVKGCASNKARDIYSAFNLITSGPFVTRDVKKWMSLRKPIDKMLEPKLVDSWIEIFNRGGDLLCEAIGSDIEDLDLPLRTFTFAMINLAETHLGLPNWKDYLHLFPTYLKDMEELLAITMMRTLDITIKPDMLFKMSRHYPKFLQAKLHGIATHNLFLDGRKAYLKENNLEFNEERCFSDFLILHAKQLNCDDEETFKLGVDFIVGSVHAITFTLATAILFLAMHPECQKKLYEEIQTVFGESTEATTEEQLNRLKYLDMVVKETLRHAGPTAIARDLEKDLEFDEYVFPKNSILGFNLIKLNYNPKHWERPKEFFPEHFTPEAEAARPRGTFLPFSAGARSCPGKLYGTTSVKIGVMKAVQQFEFSTPLRFEDVEFSYNTVRIPSVYHVVAKRRTVLNKL